MVQIVILNEVKDLLRFFVASLLRMTTQNIRAKKIGKVALILQSAIRFPQSGI